MVRRKLWQNFYQSRLSMILGVSMTAKCLKAISMGFTGPQHLVPTDRGPTGTAGVTA